LAKPQVTHTQSVVHFIWAQRPWIRDDVHHVGLVAWHAVP
jgi:hypothetical protein